MAPKKKPTPIRRPAEFTPITLSRVTALKLHQKMVVRDTFVSLANNAIQQLQDEFSSVCEILGIDPEPEYTVDFPTRRMTLAVQQPGMPSEGLSIDQEPDDEDDAE